MASFVEQLSSAKGKVLWLDYTDYAGKLLAGGAVPWLDVGALVAWQRKAQGLLKSDVVALPLAPLCAAWLKKNPALAAAMAEKKRAPYPLKTLLADAPLRAHIAELLAGLRASFAGVTLALVIPSPRQWVALAYAQAHGGAEVEAGADETDTAAMYLADFLRAFGESGVDVLLLEESERSEPASSDELEWYRPVLNVAAHYRWVAGLRLPLAKHGVGGIDFIIAPRKLNGAHAGIALAPDFWKGAAAEGGDGFRYAVIPADAKPETVLDRLAVLRK